jgi:malate dehydrogenase
MRKKIAIIGAGNVGSTTAQLVAEKNIGDVALLDIAEGIAKGKALDIQEACPLWGSSSKVIGTASYQDTADSDIVVITAGLARKPGMSRDDLVEANARIVRSAAENIKTTSPKAIVIVVTNPMDVMAYLTYKVTGFPKNRIIGMGGILDATRFATFVADELQVSYENVNALVLGGHGDSMTPLPTFTTVGSVSLPSLLSQEKISALIERTRNGGAEIVKLLQTGSAFYAPGVSTLQIIEAVVKDKHKLLPCSVYLQGEYGIHDTFTGAPAVISANGVEKIIELALNPADIQALQASAEAVRQMTKKLSF